MFTVTVLLFTAVNWYLNEFYVIGVGYLLSLPVFVYVPFVLLSIINTLLVGVSMVMMSTRIKLLRAGGLIRGGGVSAVGSFVGLLSGACPACIAGFFPVVMGWLGQTQVTLPGLPLYGLELQIFSAVLLGLGIYFLSKPIVCKV